MFEVAWEADALVVETCVRPLTHPAVSGPEGTLRGQASPMEVRVAEGGPLRLLAELAHAPEAEAPALQAVLRAAVVARDVSDEDAQALLSWVLAQPPARTAAYVAVVT